MINTQTCVLAFHEIETPTGTPKRYRIDNAQSCALSGARMERAPELEEGQKMREALIKQLTGGDEILVRRMMQELVEVVPQFSLTIQGNHKPETGTPTTAFAACPAGFLPCVDLC